MYAGMCSLWWLRCWRRRVSCSFCEQTDLSNPDDGGVHDGKDALVVWAGAQSAPVAQLVEIVEVILVPWNAFSYAQWSR